MARVRPTALPPDGAHNPRICRQSPHHHRGYPTRRIGREDVGSASGSGPASAVLAWYGRRVGSLGPGLTSESADAARAVLRDDLSAGPQVYGTRQRCRPDLPGLGRGRGSQLRRPAGACHPFNHRKEMALTIVETPITGGAGTHADVHVAAALDPVGGLLGV